jgi:hypothetical protein
MPQILWPVYIIQRIGIDDQKRTFPVRAYPFFIVLVALVIRQQIKRIGCTCLSILHSAG